MLRTTCCRRRRTDDNRARDADAADGEGLTRLPRPACAGRQTPAGASVGRKRGAPGGAARRAGHVAAVPEHPTRTSTPPRRLTSDACAACYGRPRETGQPVAVSHGRRHRRPLGGSVYFTVREAPRRLQAVLAGLVNVAELDPPKEPALSQGQHCQIFVGVAIGRDLAEPREFNIGADERDLVCP